MNSRKSSAVNVDPYDLNRLADELVARERNAEGVQSEYSSHDLPHLKPLSHDDPFLTAPEFNVEEFLLSRSYTSLPDLRRELREYLATLKEELVKLLNDDYEAFISLSTDLRGEGTRLERMKWPLDELRSRVMVAKNQLRGVEDNIREKLDRRAALREEKALLQLLLKISDSISRLESLLLISSPGESRVRANGEKPDDRTKDNRAKHLLRTATEYNQLLYHSEKALSKNCAFVKVMQGRVDRIQMTLSSDLADLFTTTLLALVSTNDLTSTKQKEAEHTRSISNMIDCLRAYDMLGLWREAEDVIKREVVTNFINKIIYPGCLSDPQSPVLPRTPLYQSQRSTQSWSDHPPRTPYTPYTTLPTQFFSSAIDLDSSIYLLDDSDNTLANLLNNVLRFVAVELKPILDIAEQVGAKKLRSVITIADTVDSSDVPHGPQGSMDANDTFNLFGNVIWSEIARTITDDLGTVVFSAGKPDDFRKNYETIQSFISSLEYLAPSLRSVKQMRKHASFIAFQKKWQLNIYFQLRWKDIVNRVEEALQSTVLTSSSLNVPDGASHTSSFLLSQSAAVWDAIVHCWSADVYVSTLGHRFWRLTLQIIKRYHLWLIVCISDMGISSTNSTTDKVTTSTRTSTPVSAQPQDGYTQEHAADDDKLLSRCSVLMQDIREMTCTVKKLWAQQISLMLPYSTSNETDDIQTEQTYQAGHVLEASLGSLSNLLSILSSQIESILIQRCCDALAPVKSLPGQFRASQRQLPNKPSPFVPMILRPIKAFFGVDSGEGHGKALRDEFCAQLSSNVCEAVANRYMLHISGMRKNQESLRRLRMGQRSGFSLFTTSASNNDEIDRDEERVRTQLQLDVTAVGNDAKSLGVDISKSTAFKALEDMLHRSSVDTIIDAS